MKTTRSTLLSALHWLASPRLLLWLMPALMLLIVVGTVAQKYVGLYVAERTIFSSFILWGGGYLPLPGGYALMSFLGLNLTLKFILKSRWTWARSGINLAHLGALLLLFGGLVIALLSEDGFITIPEGEARQAVVDYHQREILLVKDGQVVASVPQDALRTGLVMEGGGVPFRLEVLSACRNCKIERRTGEGGDDLRSMARGMQLSATALMKQDEANTGGVTFRVQGAGSELDGTYILFEDGPTAKIGDYTLVYAKQQRPLPFSLKLVDFEKEVYPGTDRAKSYRSDVLVKQGDLEWPARIEMNKPLRLAGYTLYQSSFLESNGQQATVLTVSHNRGQWFPYVATAILGAGLVLHLVQVLRRRRV